MTPLIDALPINWLMNLFGARSMDGAAATVKFNARRLEIEAAEIQYASHCRLEVVHHVLILHAQDLDRKSVV